MGEMGDSSPHREELPEGAQFVARVPLDKEGSVLRLSNTQVRAVEQFSLPRDLQLLQEMPTVGLHFALKSYFLRGALIEQELFSRLSHACCLPVEFEQRIAEVKRPKEVAENKVKELEAERSRRDSKWRRELGMKDDQIKGLHTHRFKQSAIIAELKNKLGRLEKELTERDARLKYLNEEVDLKKCHRLEAQAEARFERLAADHARLDFKEERAAHEAAQAKVKALEAQVAALDSEAHRTAVIEESRHSPLGRVEVALACKADFDYLTSRLPSRSQPLTDSDYPPRVSVCLDFLKELETAGGGITMEVDGGDDEVENEQTAVSPATSPTTQPAPARDTSADLPSPTPALDRRV